MIDVFDVISETINSDHELGLDMYFGDRIVQTLSMLDEGCQTGLARQASRRCGRSSTNRLTKRRPF